MRERTEGKRKEKRTKERRNGTKAVKKREREKGYSFPSGNKRKKTTPLDPRFGAGAEKHLTNILGYLRSPHSDSTGNLTCRTSNYFDQSLSETDNVISDGAWMVPGWCLER